MSDTGGMTAKDPSAWTPDLLYLYLLQRIEATEQIAHVKIEASEQLTAARITMLSNKLDERYVTQQTAMEAARLAAEKAVTKAETASEKRFEGVNEFRAQLADQQGTFMPRAEANARIDALTDKINDAVSRLDVNQGKGTGTQQSWGVLIGAVGLIAVLISTFVVLAGK